MAVSVIVYSGDWIAGGVLPKSLHAGDTLNDFT